MSQIESEHWIGEASKTRNVAQRGKLVQKSKRYLRFGERKRKKDERDNIAFQLSRHNEVGAPALSALGRQDLARYQRTLEEELEADSPPDKLPGETRDALVAEERKLAEFIQGGMQTEEEMRRNYAGSVAKYDRWQRQTKDAINKWKNLRILNNPESDDPDLANVEILRPRVAAPGMAPTFVADAQIPGVFAMTPQAKENWPENMPEYGEVNSPWKAALERENQELKDRLEALEKATGLKAKRKYVKRPLGEKRPWVCNYIDPDTHKLCGKEFDLRQKGVHMAYHANIHRDVAKMEVALVKLRTEREAREKAERDAKSSGVE